jgi:uridine kinase
MDNSILNSRKLNQITTEVRKTSGNAPFLVALDGRSGAGKSTLARQLAAELGATVVEGDDFYAGGSEAEWDARSAAEKAALCIDWRRLRSEALEPLLAGSPATWHPYDFETGAAQAPHTRSAQPTSVIILDGVYSGRPELADLVDLAVLVELEEGERRARLAKRESEYFLREWFGRWDEGEQYYFSVTRPPASFNIVVSGNSARHATDVHR